MSAQKIIYVSLIALLAVSLQIPTLSAQGCPICDPNPCTCDEDGVMYPGDEGFALAQLTAEVDKKIVNRPASTADKKEIVKLNGWLTWIPTRDYGISGVPVYIKVSGPEGRQWELKLIGYTGGLGEFTFDFEIMPTAPLGEYIATIYAYGLQTSVSFEVVAEKTFKATVITNLPPGASTDITIDDLTGPEIASPHSGEIEFTSGLNYKVAVEKVVPHPENPNQVLVCTNNVREISAEYVAARAGFLTFEYKVEYRFPVYYHPSTLYEHIVSSYIQCDSPDNCVVSGDPTDTFALDLPEQISVSQYEILKFAKFEWLDKSYERSLINLTLKTLESETDLCPLNIYYHRYYYAEKKCNIGWLEESIWVREGSNVPVPLKIQIGPGGIGGECIRQSITGDISTLDNGVIKNIDGPVNLYLHYDYSPIKPASVGFAFGGFAGLLWYWNRHQAKKTKPKAKFRKRKRGGDSCFRPF